MALPPPKTDARRRVLALADGEEFAFDVRLPDAPIRPGSVRVWWYITTGERDFVEDDGAGNWLYRGQHPLGLPGGVARGLDYRTGRLVVDCGKPPQADSKVYVEYRVADAPAPPPPDLRNLGTQKFQAHVKYTEGPPDA